MPNLYDFQARTIDGEARALGDYRDKVVLIVNVASRCGLTPQYDGLERLYESYRDRGLEVLGFPCNQFAGQEPGSDAEVKEFCTAQYGVRFPLFSKIDVNGDAQHPLYAWLTQVASQPDGPGDIAWNFAKFLVGRDGNVIARFSPRAEPESEPVKTAIEQALRAEAGG